jgi:hypothetical protein
MGKYRRGDTHPSDITLLFWRYQNQSGKICERWATKDQFSYNKNKLRLHYKNYITKPEKKEKKRLSKKLYRSRPEIKEHEKLQKIKYLENDLNYKNMIDNMRLYCSEKRASDILFKIKENLRNRINIFCKNTKFHKKTHTLDILGCSPFEFRLYIENKFIEDMSWDNYGRGKHKWNLDHIIPLSKATTVEEMHELCHYTNIQPLWFIDNVIKGGFKKYER